jgi:hypothetical protein
MTNRDKRKLIETRFEPAMPFEIEPGAAVPPRGTAENDLEELKARLLRQLVAPVEEPDLNRALRRAANEAASLAWFTPFPLLFFPTLLEEKALTAKRQRDRQQDIRQRSQGLVEEAVS